MKVIIAGSRDIIDINIIEEAIIESQFIISEVISGTARGVDRLGEQWAEAHNISIKRFPADWAKLGKMAGVHRNADMAKYGDALIAIWDGKSKGTKSMIKLAEEYQNQIYKKVVKL